MVRFAGQLALAACAVLLLTGLGANAAFRKDVQFKALDPNMTDPSLFFYSINNTLPQEYVEFPRYPIVPSEGPIAMDNLLDYFGNGTALPTNTWQKNLWGFGFDDYTDWSGIYPYPYIAMPRDGNVNLMYPGKPGPGDHGNSRISYDVIRSRNVTGSGYPVLTMSTAFDFGVIINKNAVARITNLTDVAASVGYFTSNDTGATPVATVHFVKGSPYINIECDGADISFGSYVGAPPVIQINGNAPGTTSTDSTFVMEAAVGADHLAGTWWHVYFDEKVEVVFPTSPDDPPYVSTPYTGLLQIACGEVNDTMADFLNKYAGVYATGASVSYSINETDAGDSLIQTFTWDKHVSSSAAGTDLAMLALPHHTRAFAPATGQDMPSKTPFWCVKGPMSYVTGDSWSLGLPLETRGFGDDFEVTNETRKAVIEEQLLFDYAMYIDNCPGFNVSGQGLPGYQNVELYSYVRDLQKYTELAIVAKSLGYDDMSANMTKHVWACYQPMLEYQTEPPQPCEPPVYHKATCIRNELVMYHDDVAGGWGGIVTGWYTRFAVNYTSDGNNEEGYYPFANYGNGFYNDHELQYGYVVHNLAWILNEYHAGVDLGINASRAANITELALLFAREYANPVEDDYYFTRLRQKDVFDGHSWQEGYDYSGRVLTWVNQQPGGEAINGYYAVYLLGMAINDTNVRDWGRVLMATEMQSVRTYQLLDSEYPDEPYEPVQEMLRSLPMLIGNGLTGADYVYPSALFQLGVVLQPITPVTVGSLVEAKWAGEVVAWIQNKTDQTGFCIYPDEAKKSNPCPQPNATNWEYAYECCPLTTPVEACPECQYNLWKQFPNWLCFNYIVEAVNDTDAGWEHLQVDSVYEPTEYLPFPYVNSVNTIIGYEPALSRTWTLFLLATMETNKTSTITAAAASAAQAASAHRIRVDEAAPNREATAHRNKATLA